MIYQKANKTTTLKKNFITQKQINYYLEKSFKKSCELCMNPLNFHDKNIGT